MNLQKTWREAGHFDLSRVHPSGMTDAPRVLFIAGWGRSGSTILSSILGQIDGMFDAGEIHNIWHDRPCSCGVPFSQCALWGAVFDEAFGSIREIDGAHVVGLAHRVQTMGVLTSRFPGRRDALMAAQIEYVALLARLYRAIRKVTGCSTIVDASKKPGHGFVLANMSGIDLSVLHLVRDPRGVAHSWMKAQPYATRTSWKLRENWCGPSRPSTAAGRARCRSSMIAP
jgi:hypothetical protein